MRHLDTLLRQTDPDRPKIIVFESVYSMSGNVAPIRDICDLAHKYGALTFLDEVHAVGLYGPTGAGMAEHLHVGHRPTIISGTLAKGFGVFGGYIASSDTICDSMRSFSRGFIFTTSLPPAVVVGAMTSIRHLKRSSFERDLLHKKVQTLKSMLVLAKIPFIDGSTHILTIMIGDALTSKWVSDLLLHKHNIYVQNINFPTVARGTERLRLTPGPTHTDTMLQTLVDALQDVFQTVRPVRPV
jgi:5-aminolevulinate synthase